MIFADSGNSSEDPTALLISVAIIVVAGLIGGSAASLAAPEEDLNQGRGTVLFKYVTLGLVASACVPLFLSLVRSKILDSIMKNSEADRLQSYLVFAGLCLLAAFLGRRFIDTLSERILQQVHKTQEEVRQTQMDVKRVDEKTDTALEVLDDRAAEPVAENQIAQLIDTARTDSPVQIDTDEEAVLRALTKKTFRTATGVASDAGISRFAVGEVLDGLSAKGLAEITQSPTTKGVRWKITPSGIAALKQR